MRTIRRGLIAFGMVLALCAQEPPMIRGGIELVDVLATIRDKKNGLVKDLKASEVHVFEDGIEQPIRRFVLDSDQQLTIGMLVDVSSSLEDEIPREQKAAIQFFKQVLRPDDKGFVIGFSGKAVLLQDLSSELEDLEGGLLDLESAIITQQPSLDRTSTQQFQRGGGGGGFGMPGGQGPFGGGPGGGRRMGGATGTVLYDALYLAGNEVLKPVSGRKVIVLLSDGEDYGSKVQLAQALEAAVKADTLVYSIYVKPDFGTGDGEEIMERMSDKTGGRLFELTKRANLEKIFKEIEEELRSQYSISYSPKRGLTGRGFRNIEIRVDRKDHKVQAREGYYPQPAARK